MSTQQIVDCEDCDGTGVEGEAYGGNEFQPPEHDECTSCGGSGKWKIETHKCQWCGVIVPETDDCPRPSTTCDHAQTF